ncbi:MAG TPA: imidazoleglycerol-phosphate dehydratase HisB [Kiritimatiellia bacterium]|nr:imidazoleglycerol-phosphate dehydratase HisB [Kiritimatiellia bacterium]
MKTRKAKVERKTRETDILLELDVDGSGKSNIETGIPFFNHMLELFSRHSMMDVTVKANGDLDVDYHHTVEDVGLVLGQALDEALGDRVGISRYGSCLLPMDEALSEVAVDLGGRPYLVYSVACRKKKIRDFDVFLVKHFFESLAQKARMNLHIHQRYGEDVHHAYESMFKGVARALYVACCRDPRVKGVLSSKGRIG